jgi:hypothetical protein
MRTLHECAVILRAFGRIGQICGGTQAKGFAMKLKKASAKGVVRFSTMP